MVKRHKSPKTGGWEICRAQQCPYKDIPEAAYAKLLPVVKREDLAVANHLRIATILPVGNSHTQYAAQSTDEPLRIAPVGYTAASCLECGAYLPHGYWEAAQPEPNEDSLKRGPDSAPCPNPDCAATVFPTDCNVDVAASESRYWDANEVKRAHWFHVTTREDWLNEAAVGGPQNSAVLVHVGSREAAMWRLRDLMYEAAKSRAAGESMPRYYLYEMQVDVRAPINPHVMEDSIDGWPEFELPDLTGEASGTEHFDTQLARIYQQDGITRYLNVCEAPGTVSLMANARVLQQVSRHEIPFVAPATA